MANLDIIQELNDLESPLANGPFKIPYVVPEGYFEGLPARLLEMVSALEAGHELSSALPKENPYQVPAGYFESFADSVLNKIHSTTKEQTPAEELASLSPLLSSLSKEPVYSVPEGYFENLTVAVKEKPAKVVSLSQRKWLRYAAAAVIVAAVTVTGFFVIGNNKVGSKSADGVLAKVEKDVKKINDVKETQNMIEMMDAGVNEKSLAQADVKTYSEVQKLLQDVPADELQDFNEQSKDIEDVMMTN
jgi:hypothetical protein